MGQVVRAAHVVVVTALIASILPLRATGAQLDPTVRDRVLPAAIQIAAIVVATENGQTEEQLVPRGSGTVVSPDGIILTNYHVVDLAEVEARVEADQAAFQRSGRNRTLELITDRFILLFSERDEPPQRRFTARVVEEAPGLDLAVLAIVGGSRGQPLDPSTLSIPYVALGDSDKVQIGDRVHLFGYPVVGSGMLTYTEGVVSGFDFQNGVNGRAWINSDATISGGSSGGTAVDSGGLLIGIPTLAAALDCRPGDTNGDGIVDESDVGCIPVGGSLVRLRPVNLARPLLVKASPEFFGIELSNPTPVVIPTPSPTATTPNPRRTTLEIEVDGELRPYQVFVDWRPLLVMTPDGGAWAFFSAAAELATGELDTKRLYAARFSPGPGGGWDSARAVPGGDIQFGPAAVVDGEGVVQLVYTDRASGLATSYGVLMHRRIAPDGTWSEATPVAPSARAGHQIAPSMAIGPNGELFVAWQDQRLMDEEARVAAASNANVFVSRLEAGSWTDPDQIDALAPPGLNGLRPDIFVSGDSLHAVWSAYDPADTTSAEAIFWAHQPLDGSLDWGQPESLAERNGDQIGGRFLDVAPSPDGGAVLVFGRRQDDFNVLYVSRFRDEGWDEPSELISGSRGSYISLAVAADGTAYVAYNLGSGDTVDAGALAIAADSAEPGDEVNLTGNQAGGQGITNVAVDANGAPWVIYFHEDTGQPASEVRVIQWARIPGP